jgi:hypothetical protein
VAVSLTALAGERLWPVAEKGKKMPSAAAAAISTGIRSLTAVERLDLRALPTCTTPKASAPPWIP